VEGNIPNFVDHFSLPVLIFGDGDGDGIEPLRGYVDALTGWNKGKPDPEGTGETFPLYEYNPI